MNYPYGQKTNNASKESRIIDNKNMKLIENDIREVDGNTKEAQKTAIAASTNVSAAVSKAEQAISKADSTQAQLNNVIIQSGTSNAETIQLRTDLEGNTYSTAQERANADQQRVKNLEQNSVAKVVQDMSNGLAVSIDCFGDSTYYGQVSGSTGQVSVPAPLMLQNTLRDYFGNTNILVNNRGVPGNQTTNALRTFDNDMKTSSAQMVYINYGLNDLSGANPSGVSDPAISAEQYRKNLRSMVAIARKYNKIIIIESANVELANHVSSNFQFRMEGAQQFAAAAKQVAREMNVPYIDQQYLTKKYLKRYPNVPDAFPDGIHPSQAVYRQKGLNMALPLIHPIPLRGQAVIPSASPGVQGTSPLRSSSSDHAGSKTGVFFFSDTSVRVLIYIDEPGLDVYLASLQYTNGADSCDLKVDGNVVSTISLSDSDFTSVYAADSELLVMEDAVPGVHLIELKNKTTTGRVGFYYLRTYPTRKTKRTYAANTANLPYAIQKTQVVNDLVIVSAEKNQGHIMLDIPTSRTLKTLDIEMAATLSKGDGIMLFAKPNSDNAAPHAGLVLWLDVNGGFLKISEGKGTSSFTTPVSLDNVDHSGVSANYRITVTTGGVVTVYFNGVSVGTYTMTKPHYGGFLGFYKDGVGNTRIDRVSLN